jgi:uncharacterized protein YbaR (Trm112 family)
MLDKLLVLALACPACDSRPAVVQKDGALECPECGRRYPVVNGIPRMIADETRTSKDIHGVENDEPAT